MVEGEKTPEQVLKGLQEQLSDVQKGYDASLAEYRKARQNVSMPEAAFDAVVESKRAAETTLKSLQRSIIKAEGAVKDKDKVAKQGAIGKFQQSVTDKVRGAVDGAACQELEIDKLMATIAINESGQVSVNVRPSGPGVLIKRQGSGTRRGSLGEGQSWTSLCKAASIDLGGLSPHKAYKAQMRKEHDAIPHTCTA